MDQKILLTLLFSTTLLGLTWPGAAQSNIPRTSQFDQQWLKTVVSIERTIDGKDTSVGTGFVVMSPHKQLLLVTAKHVVQDAAGQTRSNLAYRLNRVNASFLLRDEELVKQGKGNWFASERDDLAVRFLPGDEQAPLTAIPLELFVSSSQVEAGTPLMVLGFPMGLRSAEHPMPIARQGMIGRADSNRLLADLVVFPGNSGGPVLYVPTFRGGISLGGRQLVEQERFVGVVSSYIAYAESAISQQTKQVRIIFEENSGLAYLVPAWSVLNFITTGPVEAFDKSLATMK
jgi:S1-C subfamily serine protease